MWLFPHQDIYLRKKYELCFYFSYLFFNFHVVEDIVERTKLIKSFSLFIFLTNPPLLKHHHQWPQYLSYTNLFSLHITHSYISLHPTKTGEINESFEWFNVGLFWTLWLNFGGDSERRKRYSSSSDFYPPNTSKITLLHLLHHVNNVATTLTDV